MRTESSLLMKLTPHLVIEQISVHRWNWRSVGAVCGFCLGILSPVIGSILTAIAWVTGPQWHGYFIRRDGTVLFFLTIPLLILGAHCLDLMDQKARDQTNEINRNDVRSRSSVRRRSGD